MLNILYGIISIDDGSIERSLDLKIGYLNQMEISSFAYSSVEEILENNFSYIKKIEKKLRQLEQEMYSSDDENIEALLEQYQNCLDLFETYGEYNYEQSYQTFCKPLSLTIY
ncbi:MAG: hypothetical protein LUE12_07055 [Ruminococcus sp.]|nr:hypothetical protein [Ruminococcus sp.]